MYYVMSSIIGCTELRITSHRLPYWILPPQNLLHEQLLPESVHIVFKRYDLTRETHYRIIYYRIHSTFEIWRYCVDLNVYMVHSRHICNYYWILLPASPKCMPEEEICTTSSLKHRDILALMYHCNTLLQIRITLQQLPDTINWPWEESLLCEHYYWMENFNKTLSKKYVRTR